MKHFLPLEACQGCGARQYLAAREFGKSYEIVLIHDGQERKYAKVAEIRKSVLDYHDKRNPVSREGGSVENLLEQITKIGSNLVELGTEAQKRIKMQKNTEKAQIEP